MDYFAHLNKEEMTSLLSFPLVIFRDIVLVRDDNYSVQSIHVIHSIENGLRLNDKIKLDSSIDQFLDLFLFNVDKLYKEIYNYKTLRSVLSSIPFDKFDQETSKSFFNLYNIYVESLAEGSFIPVREKKDKRLELIANDIKENLEHYRQLFSIENFQK